MKSRVTTKQGDDGTSRTLAGEVLPKSHVLFECCGWIDSLRAHTALLRLELIEQQPEEFEDLSQFLLWVMHAYFLIGTACNDPLRTHPEYRKGEIGPDHLRRLEEEQERLEASLRLPKAFVVSATNRPAALADLTATVARALERQVVRLKEAEPGFEAAHILAFVNRLSDYFYVLARYLEEGRHHAVNYGVLEG
ncbi:MAG TPA: ATP:cob(I)alamin adenosyltransferase [Candidatus Hydrogenedentes bacterium]|nr:ATP:cob(I)alamin adenosyltransferase [Candidatus Hydrogenedentota bacterium]HNT87460.1 ATP:cob(I)alamin adenosyltransferase [Candidatus Hydrogenedentota bacterium]